MVIEKLTILGFSEATITMLLDILDSHGYYPVINVVNNLGLIPTKKYEHPKFLINIVDDATINDKLITLGVIKPHLRKKVRESFKVLDGNFNINLISKKSDISNTVNIGKGIVINTMTCIAGHTKIDDFVFINRNVSIGHHTVIGKYTTINPGVNIAGNVTIGECCQIGIGVNIIDGVKIGDNTIIGAGSLVTKDIPDNVVAYGNPCKIIRENG
jgi:sugar O-acyltransferase (sialic acid O-acetyltransferase NeuD family)